MREALTFCRICPGYCGLVLSIDDDNRIIKVRGDSDHAMSDGFACIKGLQSAHLYHGPQRVLHPQRREADGGFARVATDAALDAIAERIALIRDRDGPDAIGFFKGGNNYQNTLPSFLQQAFINALGTRSLFTNNTIDQSAKAVSADRLGSWNAGRIAFERAEVVMIVGGNPLVSIANYGFDAYNPVKKLKAFKKRGGKLIVIDPRRTETAAFADIFLQPRPGQDVAIAAGLLHVILGEDLLDHAFCVDHAKGLESLRQAIAPFNPALVAQRADIAAGDLIAIARLLASTPRALTITGIGPSMAPNSNLMQHLFDELGVLCGHFPRVGERVCNPGLRNRDLEFRAHVNAPGRCWEYSPKSRVRGHGLLFGEKMTATLAEEITTPGDGQVRMLIVDGGNPASSICDQDRIVSALRQLEMLVTIDPEMTPTSRLAHYVLPPKLQFEHPNMVGLMEFETAFHQRPAQQFVPAAIAVPPGSELVDDWAVYYQLAQRLGLELVIDGVAIDMENQPAPEDLFRILFRNGHVGFDEIAGYPHGKVFDITRKVLPADPAVAGRFDLAPPDVVRDLAAVAAAATGAHGDEGRSVGLPGDTQFDLLLITRRLREVFNSAGRTASAIKARQPFNAAYMHPEDMSARGLSQGDTVRIASDNGAIFSMCQPDPTLRPGVVSMAAGWGGLPEDGAAADGCSVGPLVSTVRDCEEINAMPRQSAIPISVSPTQSQPAMSGAI